MNSMNMRKILFGGKVSRGHSRSNVQQVLYFSENIGLCGDKFLVQFPSPLFGILSNLALNGE